MIRGMYTKQAIIVPNNDAIPRIGLAPFWR